MSLGLENRERIAATSATYGMPLVVELGAGTAIPSVRRFGQRASIDGGQPSYDQAAALFAVRGAEKEFWSVVSGGRVAIDAEGVTKWQADPVARHAYVKLAVPPVRLAMVIEDLMVTPPNSHCTRDSR